MLNVADLQKTLPTTDLNKKNLSFDKISPHDFYFFSFLFNLYLWSSIIGLPSQLLKLNFWLSRPENLIRQLLNKTKIISTQALFSRY